MGFLVNESQSAFVKGRLIINNTLLAHELVKSYGRKHLSPRVMINIDIRKAFDTISWDFLNDMLQGLGFPNMMINWIMTCISTPKFSISFNGSLHGYFKGERGLRQGDPLSPYLFILGMEYLSRSLSLLKDDKQFKFHPKCGKLKINHLIFADDLLLFGRGDLYTIQKLHQCLIDFSSVTGLEANPGKCSVYYGGVEQSIKNSIHNLLGFTEGSLPIKYLGLPLTNKRLSFNDCSPLFNKINSQFQNWRQHRNLSYAGRLLIIKSVILGVQTFWTSTYILPTKVLQRIDQLCRNFLWGSTDQVHRASLISWNNVCLGKEHGGLGIYSAVNWNAASALRLLWYISTNKELLWIKWIHGNYLKNCDIWHVNVRTGDSWLWKQMIKIRDKAIAKCGGIDNLKQLLLSCCKNSKLKLSDLYTSISPAAVKVPWHDTVWDSMNYPKHSFILWLTIKDRLQTQDTLLKRGIIQNNICCLCTASLENRNHLFFECHYSMEVWNQIMSWLRMKWRSCDWNLLLTWYTTRQRGKGLKAKTTRLALSSTVYNIWCERNLRIFQRKSKSSDQVVRSIKSEVLTILLNSSLSPENKEWVDSL